MFLRKKLHLVLILVGILVLVYLIYHNLTGPLSEDTFAEIYVELSLLPR